MSSLQTLRQRMQRERRDGLHSGPSYRDIPTTAPGTTSPMGKLRKDMRLQNQRNQVKLAAKSLHASPQTGVAIYDLRDKAIVQRELDTVTSELDALEKQYPSKVYAALSQKADLDVAVPMLGPVENDATLQKETADYSARKSALQKKQKALNAEIAAIDTAQQLWVETERLSELTGGYDPEKDREAGRAGWDAYQAYVAEKTEVAQTAKKEETFWEKMGRWYSGSHVDTSLPLHVDANQLAQGAQQQESKKRMPQEDWSEDERFAFGFLWRNDSAKAANYAYAINSRHLQQKEQEQLQWVIEDATSSLGGAAMHTIGSVLSAPLGLADYLDDLISQNTLGYIPQTDGQVTPFEYSQTVTGSISQDLNDKYGTLNEDIPVIGGKGWGDVYSLGTGIAQSSLAAYVGGPGQALIQFFGSSAASGIDDALSRGATGEQAVLYGTMLGAADGVAEMIGVDNLFKLGSVSTFRQLFWNLIKQGTAEGIEEGITSVLNNFADNLVMRDKSNFYALAAKYITEDGLSEEKAKRRAWLEIAEDVAYETLAGNISGMTHAAGHEAAVDTGFRNYYDSIIQMEGDLYGAEKANDVGRTETDTDANKRNTRTADAKRPGIQEAVGETGAGAAEIHFPGGQHRGLTASDEDFDAHDYVVVDEDTELGHIRQELEHNGIECRVVRGDAWKRAAPAYAHNGRVYISQDIDQETLPTVIPHETTHVMKQRGFQQYLKYVEDIPDMLLMREEEAWKLLDMAAKHRGVDMFEMSDTDFINLYDEMNAIVYGMYRGGILEDPRYDYGQWIPGAFKDFDSYIRQMDAIHGQFKERSGTVDSQTDNISEIMSLRRDIGADNSTGLSDRDVLSQVLESTDLQTVEPRLRPVLREYGRHLQQLKTIESLQQKQQAKIAQLQTSESSANALQIAKRDLTKLEQLHARQLERLKKLEQNASLKELIEEQSNGVQFLDAQNTGSVPSDRKSVLENSLESNIISSGAISGARITDTTSLEAEKHAESYYGLVRSMQTDVIKISKTTGYPVALIQQVKQYIFVDEHDLGEPELRRFDPSFAMAQSWQRLIEGNPEPHDLTMLQHEILEKELISQGWTQYAAHIEASKKYNYAKESDEFYAALKTNKNQQ